MPLILIASLVLVFVGRGDPFYNDVSVLLNMWLIPLVAGFLLTVVIPNRVNGKRSAILLIPSIGVLIAFIFTHNPIFCKIALIYTISIAAPIFLLVVIISIHYDKYLKNNFSNIDSMTVGWVRYVVFVFASWYLAWNFVLYHNNKLVDVVYYLFVILIWTFIYKFSVKHITSFEVQQLFESTYTTITEETETRKREPLNNKLALDLELHIKEKQPWLNPTLTLQDLAWALNTNRTYLSEYFNKTLDTTFYDYMNSLRIKHACDILSSEPNLSLLQVGEKSGFNSLSTFRRAFEKHMGCTPAQFRKQ